MRWDRGLGKIEDRAVDLGREPRSVPDEISDWFSVNRDKFGGGVMTDGKPIPHSIKLWVSQAVNWIEVRSITEMMDWELNVILAAEPGTWSEAELGALGL